MFKFFKRVRRRLLSEGKLKRYLIYAIGEIILVVLGILIALQINNWNIGRVEKKEEIAILQGIKENILRDTVDMNYNIGIYDFTINSDSILLNHLVNAKENTPEISRYIFNQYTNSLHLILHQSSFEEAKTRGLKIISNPSLRKDISRLYEFDYVTLLMSENESDLLIINSFNQYMMDNKLIQMKSVEDNITTVLPEDKYQMLVNDKHFHFLLSLKFLFSKGMLDMKYYPIRQKALDLVGKIEEELERLE